jgi:hypothetical protein
MNSQVQASNGGDFFHSNPLLDWAVRLFNLMVLVSLTIADEFQRNRVPSDINDRVDIFGLHVNYRRWDSELSCIRLAELVCYTAAFVYLTIHRSSLPPTVPPEGLNGRSALAPQLGNHQ